MARGTHTRSAYAAVSMLLRNFRDDEALLRNPLVAVHYQACEDVAATAERVRALVLASLNQIVDVAALNVLDVAKRQKHILLRHDIEGATRQEVCAELGITERQMYRDRRAGSELLATHLQRALPKHYEPAFALSTGTCNRAELALRASLRMHAVGATRTAHEQIDAVARSSGDEQGRMAALCLLAANADEREDAPELLRLLGQIETTLENVKAAIGTTHADRYRAFIEISRGVMAWNAESRKEHLQVVRRGVDRFFLGQSQVSDAGDPLTQQLIRSAMTSSAYLIDAGDLAGRMTIVRDLQRALGRLANVPDYLDLELHTHHLKTQILIQRDHKVIGNQMADTMVRAGRLGLSAIASEAAHYSSWIAAKAGDFPRAQAFQSRALAFADAQDSKQTRSLAYALASLVELDIGTPKRALQLAREAAVPSKLGASGISGYVLARAHLKCGLMEEALDVGAGVANSATSGLARSATLLVMAEAAANLGQITTATSHLDEAATRLRPYGNTYLLSNVQSIRSRLKTGFA